jgi:hypothetical protein
MVFVTVALSSAKAITAFSLAGVTGTINETGKTIAVVMPYGTDVTALVATLPGRPEESHLQTPTDPYVSLSTHTARASHTLEASRLQVDAEKKGSLPVIWLAFALLELAHPLRSILITRTSSLLQDDPPPSQASILSPFVDYTYRVFSSHPVKSSYVPQ